MPTFMPDVLADFVAQIMSAAGAGPDAAQIVADSLVQSNLMGHDSHGVIRVPQYLRNMDEGTLDPAAEPEIIQEVGAVTMIDSHYGFGQVAARVAMALTIDRAAAHGLAATGMFNSGHIGRLGEWAQMASEQGMIGLVVNSGGRRGGIVAPFGGARRQFGTNPLAAAIPVQGREPVVVDFATSVVAEGKVRVAYNSGKSIPEGWILDKDGRATTNPADLYDGGVILPAAGHKGYGLALLVDFLGGILTGVGTPTMPATGRGGFGVLFMALQVAAFRPLADFLTDGSLFCQQIKDNPPATGFAEVLLPGEPEQRSAAIRRDSGISLDDTTWGEIVEAAQRLGVRVPGT